MTVAEQSSLIFLGRRAPSIDCFCLRDHWWNALPAPCRVFSGGGAYVGGKLALKSDSTVNFENCTSHSQGALGSTGKPHGERSRQGGFCKDLGLAHERTTAFAGSRGTELQKV